MCPFPYDIFRGISQPQSNSPIDRRDLLNYTGDNTIQSSRYINPLTRDFEVSSTNHLEGMNAVEQSVLLAISTTFNTSAQPGFGENFGSIKTIAGNITNQVIGVIRAALAFQIQNKQITLGQVAVVNNQYGQISVQFNYNNNTLGTTASVQFNLQGQ